jgi:hypothetical protein
MSFAYLPTVLPFLLLGIRISEEISQSLRHVRLILFHDRQVIASIPMDTGTPPLLGVHGIRTDDASFHKRWMHQRGSSTDRIFCAPHSALCQDDPALALLEG